MRVATISITCLLLGAFYVQTRDYPTASTAAPYHGRVAAMVKDLPEELGDWYVVSTPEVPPAAQKLLRPNALLSRIVRNKRTNTEATLVLVQCGDTRDMGGHYPPVCYPAAGWTIEVNPPEPARPMEVAGRAMPVQIYAFRQRSFPTDKSIRIYSFFVIPGQGFVTDIKSVRGAAEDYRVRPYGAAQVQVLFDSRVPPAESDAAFVDLLANLSPLLDALSDVPLREPQ